MKFYLIRHGESEDNLKKITSRVDTKLSANGKAQVKTCLLYTSPSPRDENGYLVCRLLLEKTFF